MHRGSVRWSGALPERERIDELTGLVKRLVRHRAYDRARLVSALLLRHMPHDSGYAWQGETRLREHLMGACLDTRTLDHLIANARFEFARLQERVAG